MESASHLTKVTKNPICYLGSVVHASLRRQTNVFKVIVLHHAYKSLRDRLPLTRKRSASACIESQRLVKRKVVRKRHKSHEFSLKTKIFEKKSNWEKWKSHRFHSFEDFIEESFVT